MRDADTIVKFITNQMEVKSNARDRAIRDSRLVIRHAANAIRALHRGDTAAAGQSLEAGREMVVATREDLAGHPDVYWAGYVQDAQKELAEAYLVAAMIQQTDLPGPQDLAVENVPYLNGLAEAASEMRRYILDIMRRGGDRDMTEAERALAMMDDVYTSLVTVDYPDALTGGLRRTVDALRAVLERTRGDLTISLRQAQLERALRATSEVQAEN